MKNELLPLVLFANAKAIDHIVTIFQVVCIEGIYKLPSYNTMTIKKATEVASQIAAEAKRRLERNIQELSQEELTPEQAHQIADGLERIIAELRRYKLE